MILYLSCELIRIGWLLRLCFVDNLLFSTWFGATDDDGRGDSVADPIDNGGRETDTGRGVKSLDGGVASDLILVGTADRTRRDEAAGGLLTSPPVDFLAHCRSKELKWLPLDSL